MKKKLLLVLSLLLIGTMAEAQTISGSLTAASPTFNRPESGTPATSLAPSVGFGTSVYYTIITVTVTTGGSYTFEGSSTYDNYGVLYNGSGFNPASPLTNNIDADDDDGPGLNFSITQTLAVGTYYLVFTTYQDGISGAFSVTTTGPASVSLPLNLLSFDGKSFAGYNNIEWQTGSEKNTASFELQRSNNGSEYASVATVAAKGEGDHTYNQQDNDAEGTVYYRLKMIDRDGQFTFSNTLKIVGKQNIESMASVSPNPAKTNLSISLPNKDLLGSEASVINV
ncbi:MAG: hypothetical protein IT256_06120, partial [Chitinophagaceae bacterium]|nr:hypothetical protein [Chitinophagaceae bacterium]